jgi:hypothetical protein
MRHPGFVVLVVVVSVFIGCGGPSADSKSDTASDEGAPGQQLEPPAKAIAHFLDAVRRGDKQAATAMFTPVAREKAKEIGLAVAPRGSETARFEVGQVHYLSDKAARVDSTWSDSGEVDSIQWNVHQVPEGWRVAGMTAVVFADEPKLELNFEDPEEMLRKLDELRTEMDRRNQSDPLQASRPQVSQDSFRR